MSTEISAEKQNAQARISRGISTWFAVNISYALLMIASLFISSNNLGWGWAWAFIAVLIGGQIATAGILILNNPALMAERGWIQEGSKGWDKVLAILISYSPLGISILAGLDIRFGWSPHTQAGAQFAALSAIGLGYMMFLWALASNRYFSAFVRIQTDRGHTVATAGPYQYVRHPGYVGAILIYLATPVALGSLWAMIPTICLVGITVIRTALEERTLRSELDGYASYAERVRYRLLPGVW